MRKKKIFVCHPYKDNPKINKENVEVICREITNNGYLPVSPLHLFSFMENDNERNDILQLCLEIINICDEVWVYGDSDGCRNEMRYADSINKPVRILHNSLTKREKINTK